MSKDKDFDYGPGDYVRGQVESKNEWTPGTLYWYEEEVVRLQTKIGRLQELKTPATRQLLNITKAALENAEAEIASLRDQLGEALVRENNLIAALEEIVNVGDGWGGQGTTGDGHARCREIARKALDKEEL
jgi:hypothetical protein